MSRDWAEDEPLDKAAETAARTVRAAGQAQSRRQKQFRQFTLPQGRKSGSAVSGTAAGAAWGGPLWERLLGRFWQVNPSGKR